MKQANTWIVSLVFVVVMAGVAAWLYPHLPVPTPTHWDMQGHANGWTPRFWAAAMWPLLMLAFVGLFALLPLISPRRFEIRPFARTYGIVVLAIQGALLVIGTIALLLGAGHRVPVVVVPLVVGALLMVLGNYMGKLRKNFFIGIRTPWTLASDAVWERTHRLGGWVFIAGGVVLVVVALAGLPAFVIIADVIAMALIPYLYSYFIYRRLEGRPQSGGDHA
ncbi:MAG: hypothetical protein OJF55_000361 [Rhodanobacteraceae bacterium]|jgi:uncharacterized membrane protein|nr:MAG: hypothetical protein OJF55_000361 [Rhodanobacteraceae bacterium]